MKNLNTGAEVTTRQTSDPLANVIKARNNGKCHMAWFGIQQTQGAKIFREINNFNLLGVNSANNYYTKVLSGLARSKPRSCKDKNLKSCPKWASNGYCTRTRRFMTRNCKKSCNNCPGKITIKKGFDPRVTLN
jgi:hypothetical protein